MESQNSLITQRSKGQVILIKMMIALAVGKRNWNVAPDSWAASLELVEGCLAQSNTAGVPDDSDDHNVNDKEDYIDNDNDVSNDDEA